MNEKKKKIIETAIGLFANRGFFSTSIQKIADESGVSKGAVYLHFRSKNELMLEIFQYYYDLMREKVSEVDKEQLPPKEKFVKQLQVNFEEFLKHKDFIIMQFREQALSLNKDVDQFIWNMKFETQKWYEKNMLNIYGEKIKPFVYDGGVMLDGIISSYFKMLIIDQLELDLTELSSFIIRRLDDIVEGLTSENEKPLLTSEMINPILAQVKSREEHLKEEVSGYLLDMQQVLGELSIEAGKAEELQAAIDFLIAENKKEEPKKFIFQGMLANFKGIDELNKSRQLIADKLNIKLI